MQIVTEQSLESVTEIPDPPILNFKMAFKPAINLTPVLDEQTSDASKEETAEI